jgi:predicted DNA-binding transcriptional regulator AlpA
MGAVQNPTTTIKGTTAAPDLDLVTPREVAAAFGMSLRTLQRLNSARTAPPRITLGKHVFYRVSTIKEWLARCEGYGAAQPAPRKSVSPSGSNQRRARRA